MTHDALIPAALIPLVQRAQRITVLTGAGAHADYALHAASGEVLPALLAVLAR